MNEGEILKAALDTYGAEAQTLMLFEEMSELTKELCKHARGKDDRMCIAEKIADVRIMLDRVTSAAKRQLFFAKRKASLKRRCSFTGKNVLRFPRRGRAAECA